MKRRYPSTDMAKCQYQPQFGCWPGAGLAVGAVALAALHSAAGLAAGPGRTQRRTKQLRTTSKCGLAQGRALAGQLGACRCSLAGPRAQAEHPWTTKAASNSGRRAPRLRGQRRRHQSMRTPKAGHRGRYPQLEHAPQQHKAHTEGKELQVHRFVSYKFRVCRHG